MRALALLIPLLQATGFAPLELGSVVAAPPTPVASLSRTDLKGEPSRLAWSPDVNDVAYFEEKGRLSYRLASVALVRTARSLQ